jgi:hypothetical protein
MRLFYSLLVFFISFQIIAYLFYVFNVCPYVSYPMNLDIANTFSINYFNIFTAIGGGAAITIVAVLMRVGTYAIYALPIWVIATFIPIFGGFVTVIPNTFGAVFGTLLDAMNPTTGTNPIISSLIGVVSFAVFIFFLGIASQREFN